MSIELYSKSGKRAYRAKFKFQGRQITKRGFATKEKAKEWVVGEKRRLKDLAANPEKPRQDVLMFSLASEMYLEDCAARYQPNTVAEKFSHVKTFIRWMGHDIPISEIGPITAQDFAAAHLKSVQDQANEEGGQQVDANKNVNRIIRNLKALWNWHNKRRHIGQNPFASVEPYPEDTPLRYVPPTEDVAAVLAIAEQWQRDFLQIMVKTGARPGEVRTLQWEDVNFSRGTITLWTRKRRGGARHPRLLNMTAQLTVLLKRRFHERESETSVFINPTTGKPLGRQDRPYKYMMERLCEAASTEDKMIKPFTFYAFRHFVATRLRDSGKVSKFEIQHILGHTRSDTTDTYLRSLVPDVKEAMSVMDDVIPSNKDDETAAAKIIKFSRA